jgi:CheY-like chemotaxis protein
MATVLVVDDDAETRKALAALLRREGYKILHAGDAYAAMGAAKKHHPDLMLLDVMIPPMDGLTFLMLLRQDQDQRDTPVILLTGLSDANTVARARDLGVKDHLVKGDYTPEQLLEAVRRHVRPPYARE